MLLAKWMSVRAKARTLTSEPAQLGSRAQFAPRHGWSGAGRHLLEPNTRPRDLQQGLSIQVGFGNSPLPDLAQTLLESRRRREVNAGSRCTNTVVE